MTSPATAIPKPLPLLGKQRKSQSPSHTKLPSMAQSPWNVHPAGAELAEKFTCVEPLAAAFQILRQVPIEKRTRVTVLGDGRLGQQAARETPRPDQPRPA